jgi:selenium metabolism protein YedF
MSKKNLIDARLLACPEPVVLTRKAILESESNKIKVLVSQEEQTENIARMAEKEGWSAHVKEKDEHFEVKLKREKSSKKDKDRGKNSKKKKHKHEDEEEHDGECCEESEEDESEKGEYDLTVFVASSHFGEGDPELGRILMAAFVKTLKEISPRPARVIFANSGVMLTTGDSDLIPELKKLEESGVEILSCGTCLDFYHLKEKLRVGKSSNMYEIASALAASERVIKI